MNRIENLTNQKQIILAQIATLEKKLDIIEECINQEEQDAVIEQSYKIAEFYKDSGRFFNFFYIKKDKSIKTFLILQSEYESNNECTITVNEIAKRAKLGTVTVKRHLKKLNEVGAITTTRNRREIGTISANSYQLNYSIF